MGPTEQEKKDLQEFRDRLTMGMSDAQKLLLYYGIARAYDAKVKDRIINARLDGDLLPIPEDQVQQYAASNLRNFLRAVQSLPTFANIHGILFHSGVVLHHDGSMDRLPLAQESLVDEETLTNLKLSAKDTLMEHFDNVSDFSYQMWLNMLWSFDD